MAEIAVLYVLNFLLEKNLTKKWRDTFIFWRRWVLFSLAVQVLSFVLWIVNLML